jgi:hypothetical protein
MVANHPVLITDCCGPYQLCNWYYVVVVWPWAVTRSWAVTPSNTLWLPKKNTTTAADMYLHMHGYVDVEITSHRLSFLLSHSIHAAYGWICAFLQHTAHTIMHIIVPSIFWLVIHELARMPIWVSSPNSSVTSALFRPPIVSLSTLPPFFLTTHSNWQMF